ncbi:MAG TPA: ABC-2 family transporter protein [Patescibacteria group bacterium]|nr:ABC-2 family transporter protein [Patescibacteria group bacterium]
MNKILIIAQNTAQETAAYRLNFVLWRARSVIRYLLSYFLWTAILSGVAGAVGGYSRAQMLTYLTFGYIVMTFVLATRTQDLGGEINEGKLSNALLRPQSFFQYLIGREIGDKVVNLVFSVAEVGLLLFILHPPVLFQSNPEVLLLTLLAVIGSTIMYFLLSLLMSLIAFWTNDIWAVRFLFFMCLEFMSGSLIPIDLFPGIWRSIVLSTPFPYVMFFPAKIYLGGMSVSDLRQGFMVLSIWIIGLSLLAYVAWRRGLKSYGADGR